MERLLQIQDQPIAALIPEEGATGCTGPIERVTPAPGRRV